MSNYRAELFANLQFSFIVGYVPQNEDSSEILFNFPDVLGENIAPTILSAGTFFEMFIRSTLFQLNSKGIDLFIPKVYSFQNFRLAVCRFHKNIYGALSLSMFYTPEYCLRLMQMICDFLFLTKSSLDLTFTIFNNQIESFKEEVFNSVSLTVSLKNFLSSLLKHLVFLPCTFLPIQYHKYGPRDTALHTLLKRSFTDLKKRIPSVLAAGVIHQRDVVYSEVDAYTLRLLTPFIEYYSSKSASSDSQLVFLNASTIKRLTDMGVELPLESMLVLRGDADVNMELAELAFGSLVSVALLSDTKRVVEYDDSPIRVSARRRLNVAPMNFLNTSSDEKRLILRNAILQQWKSSDIGSVAVAVLRVRSYGDYSSFCLMHPDSVGDQSSKTVVLLLNSILRRLSAEFVPDPIQPNLSPVSFKEHSPPIIKALRDQYSDALDYNYYSFNSITQAITSNCLSFSRPLECLFNFSKRTGLDFYHTMHSSRRNNAKLSHYHAVKDFYPILQLNSVINPIDEENPLESSKQSSFIVNASHLHMRMNDRSVPVSDFFSVTGGTPNPPAPYIECQDEDVENATIFPKQELGNPMLKDGLEAAKYRLHKFYMATKTRKETVKMMKPRKIICGSISEVFVTMNASNVESTVHLHLNGNKLTDTLIASAENIARDVIARENGMNMF
ncbi:hypothetical protein PCE1_004406 [Barthelona sp. PCE]